MASRASSIPLPKQWPRNVRAALISAIALAHRGMTIARGWCADSRIARVRLAAELERLRADNALLREVERIKDARMAAVAPARRPHYACTERLKILAVKAATGWNNAELAARFLVTPLTIATWLRRLDEQGEDALVKTAEPVNRFPDFVRVLVKHLAAVCPALGKVRIAQLLARAGLHLAPSSVRRFLVEPSPSPTDPVQATKKSGRTVVARGPNHVWGVDLTAVSTACGFWVPWAPLAVLPVWPFCWWIAAVVDHFSRRVLAAGVFRKQPTAREICALMDRATRRVGGAPRYVVTDQGVQFRALFRVWCGRRKARARYGAVGKFGSIAIVERFWRSMKTEAFAGILVPLALRAMMALVERYVEWFNDNRPHQGLGGRTPNEVYGGLRSAHLRRRLEPRARYPASGVCAAPRVAVRGRCGARIGIVISHPRGMPHLPVVELRRVA